MIQNKKIGTGAKELVLYFYEKTGLRYTNKDIMIAVKNAKNLLKVGYTYDEIKSVIDYCIAHPPEKGIYSFGYILYEMNKVIAILNFNKKQQEKTEALKKESFSNYGLKEVSNRNKMKDREIKIDTSIFK